MLAGLCENLVKNRAASGLPFRCPTASGDSSIVAFPGREMARFPLPRFMQEKDIFGRKCAEKRKGLKGRGALLYGLSPSRQRRYCRASREVSYDFRLAPSQPLKHFEGRVPQE